MPNSGGRIGRLIVGEVGHGTSAAYDFSAVAFYVTLQYDSAHRSPGCTIRSGRVLLVASFLPVPDLSVPLGSMLVQEGRAHLAIPMLSDINFTGSSLGTVLQPLAKQGSWYIDRWQPSSQKPSTPYLYPKRH